MSFALYNLVVKLFLVTTLLVPGTHNLLQGQKLSEVKAAYTQTIEQRAQLVTQLHEREEEYRTLLRQVDVLKGGPNTLQNRMELEGLLRDSRALAKRMQALQEKIRAADARLDNQRSQLVSALDARMKQIEGELAKTSASKRHQLVSTLNELRAERQRFSAPLPSAPSDGQVSKTLAMLDELEGASAEDLLAAADELQDTEDQVRDRLQAIEARIERLREAKMLARRARTFAAEDRFFDETDRSRFIAGRNTGSDSSARGSDAPTEAPTTDETGGGDQNGGGEVVVGEDEAAGGSGDPQAAPGADSDFAAGERGSDSLSDQPATPPSAPEQSDDSSGGVSTSGDVFGGGDDMLIDSQADPQTSIGAGFESDYELDSRIQKLESEQERLEKQARELEQKAEQLLKRAKDSLD